MKKESIITAVVFLGVGFLAGYIFQSERVSSLQQKLVTATSSAATAMSGGSPAAGGSLAAGAAQASSASSPQGDLPAGHPPVDDATMVKFLEDEASEKPTDPAPSLKLANLLFDKQKFSEAVPWYQKSLTLDPANVNARTDLGTAYFDLGHPQEAVKEFNQSLKIDPNHQPTLFNVIVVNIEGTHDLRAAEQAWERLHRLNPDYPNLDRLKQELDAARGTVESSVKN
ncbi:MAG: tetratricopeptide repeat protein [Terriglobia bacterium]